MSLKLSVRGALIGVVAVAVMLFAPSPSQAAFTVHSGYDLFQTAPGTTFLGVPFVGVPLNDYDFGSGLTDVGNTDVIVHRLDTVTVSGAGETGTTSLVMEALQLRSATQVDLGAGLGFYYVTLQSARGGPATTGSMAITFTDMSGGTFDSTFDVFFDLRFGGIDGMIVASSKKTLTSTGSAWDRIPPPGVILIDGVNYRLNGADTSEDFWPSPIIHVAPDGTKHVVTVATPEPASLTLALSAAGSLGLLRLLRRKSKTPTEVAAA